MNFLQSLSVKSLFLSRIDISNGSLEALKWLALLCMTIDHINRYCYDDKFYVATCIGRLAMPLFFFIFGYHLAQSGAYTSGLFTKVSQRLVIFGLLAVPAQRMLHSDCSFFPLNIMFTLAVSTVIILLIEDGFIIGYGLALLLFLFTGPLVEYNWVGIYFCMASWFFCKKPNLMSCFIFLVAYLFLVELNQNAWTLLSLFLIVLAAKIELKVPRIRHFFYYYYPAHLWLLCFLCGKLTNSIC